MQNERFVTHRLDGPGQLRLICGGINMRVPMILKDAEVPIETDIDARGLHHVGRIGFQPDTADIDLGLDVTVREQHGATLPR